MSILVTGATGFIGRNLVHQLMARGENVHILCRPTADISAFTGKNIRIFPGDILETPTIERAMEGCARVFHIAAYAKNWAKDPKTYVEVNVRGLKNVLDMAMKKNVRRIVFTSSEVTFGPSSDCPVDETTKRNAKFFTDYEYSKYLAEQEVCRTGDQQPDIITVNPSRVFGPGLLNEGNSVTRMIQLYLQGKFRLLLGDGSGMGNYAFVDDVVRGHLLAMERGKRGERYILGGENVSYSNFFRSLSEISGKKRLMFHVPSPVAMGISYVEEFRSKVFSHYPMITPGWVRTFLADWECSSEKGQRDLAYSVTPFRTALQITVDWLFQQN